MFVYYFVHVDRSIEEVERIVLKLLDGFSEAADIAYRDGERLLARVGLDGGMVSKTVRVVVGEPFRGEGEIVIPIAWEATGTTALFPKMEAELAVEALAPRVSRLTFRGSYTPPLRTVGRALDRALFHRVAEATVKHFVDRISQAIVGWPRERAAAEGIGTGHVVTAPTW